MSGFCSSCSTVTVFSGCFRKRQSNVVDIERPQQKSPAARANSRQFTARSVADQQNERPLRRLFQNLQECVGALALQFVDGVDNGDTPAALACGRSEKRDSPTDVVNADDGVELAGLLIDHALNGQQIALRLRSDAARDRMVRLYSK